MSGAKVLRSASDLQARYKLEITMFVSRLMIEMSTNCLQEGHKCSTAESYFKIKSNKNTKKYFKKRYLNYVNVSLITLFLSRILRFALDIQLWPVDGMYLALFSDFKVSLKHQKWTWRESFQMTSAKVCLKMKLRLWRYHKVIRPQTVQDCVKAG